MFELISAIEPVDALGRCRGTQRGPDENRITSRGSTFYIDDAVDLYRDYKFVIAFENMAGIQGYVTEKIVTAFLSGTIPIYYGDAEIVTRLFNPRAFINCHAFTTLEGCVDHVSRIHANTTAYEAMKHEAPIVNRTAFMELFAWHPVVTDMAEGYTSRLVTQLKGLISQ